jgi:hypothetical protein
LNNCNGFCVSSPRLYNCVFNVGCGTCFPPCAWCGFSGPCTACSENCNTCLTQYCATTDTCGGGSQCACCR